MRVPLNTRLILTNFNSFKLREDRTTAYLTNIITIRALIKMTAKYLKKLNIDYFQVINDDQVLVVYTFGYRKVITGKITANKLKIQKDEMLV